MGQKRPPSAAGESGLPFFSSHLCLSQGSIWGGGQLSLASQGACPPPPRRHVVERGCRLKVRGAEQLSSPLSPHGHLVCCGIFWIVDS